MHVTWDRENHHYPPTELHYVHSKQVRDGERCFPQHAGNRIRASVEPPGGEASGCGGYDIGCIVTLFARAMPKPARAQVAAAKHLLRYVAGTTDFSTIYNMGDFKISIVAFADASWGNDPTNGRSMSSYMVMLSKAPVKLQNGAARYHSAIYHEGRARRSGVGDEGGAAPT